LSANCLRQVARSHHLLNIQLLSIITVGDPTVFDDVCLWRERVSMRALISPEPALLGFLLDGPLHGYDLYKQVHQQLGVVWRLGLSQMYAIFNTYAAQGWVRAHTQSQGARPSKKILELTPAGRRAFEAWLDQPARGLREFRIDFFLRLYFARAAGAAATKRLIDRQMAASQKELETLRSRETGEDDFNRLARGFRIQQLNTIIKWLENNRSDLIPSKTSARGMTARSACPNRNK
jgi:DNA-binding PadR family transcriptional regulator